MEILIKRISELSSQERTQLVRVTHDNGVMQYELFEDKGVAYAAYKNGEPVALAILLDPENGMQALDVFVAPKSRKKGIGTLLVKQALKDAVCSLDIAPFDAKGIAFYTAVGLLKEERRESNQEHHASSSCNG